MPSSCTSHGTPWRRSVAACLAAGALCAALPALAQTEVSDVKLTMLTALRPAGDDVTTPDGTVGWSGARFPTSPPLYAVRPGGSAGHLFGGFTGGGPSVLNTEMYTALGMYTMRAGVSVYERVEYDPATDLHAASPARRCAPPTAASMRCSRPPTPSATSARTRPRSAAMLRPHPLPAPQERNRRAA